MIGDNDPEDAYDAEDPVDVRLAVLARVVLSLDLEDDPDRAAFRRTDLARLLRRIADEVSP